MVYSSSNGNVHVFPQVCVKTVAQSNGLGYGEEVFRHDWNEANLHTGQQQSVAPNCSQFLCPFLVFSVVLYECMRG